MSHSKIGDVQVEQGNVDDAVESFRAGMDIAKRLAESDPSNAQWQRDLEISKGRVATVHRKLALR